MAPKPLLFLLISVCFIFASANDPIHPLYFGAQELSMDNNSIIYYNFSIPIITPHFDLSITAEPIGDCDVDLFISTKGHYPNSQGNSEYYSTSYGYSAIYIASAEVKINTEYFLGVKCLSEKCNFNLDFNYAVEYYMRAQTQSVGIEYTREGTLVARVFVPESATAGHIVIAAELQNVDEIDEAIHMYANAGNEIPTSQRHHVAATVAWKDGKAAYIYKQDSHFCTNCNYTVTVEAPKKSKVILTRNVYGDIIKTPLNHERFDAVEHGSDVHYLVDTSKLNSNCSFIRVEVKPYIGFYKVYANYGELPTSYSDYRFSMFGHGDEALFIPVDESSHQQKLHITIHAETDLTYSIKIYEMGKKNLRLKLGEPEVSTIPSGSIENFLAIVDGRKDMRLTFSLHPEKGHVDLFVKSCTDKTKCFFTKTEVDKIISGDISTSRKLPIIQYSNVADGDEVVHINMDGSVCTPSSGSKIPKCYFAVAVLGTSKQGDSKFSLTATKAGLHQSLRASHPVRAHLSVDEYHYYYFTVHKDTGIESVNFQVTKISGDVGVYISRFSKYPGTNNRELAHHYNDLYAFERQKFTYLNGTYYIAVKAHTSATFSIIPIVKYDVTGNAIGKNHLVRLAEGVPQKMVLDNDNIAYFKFNAGFSDDISNGLEITLNEVQGSFTVCLRSDEQLPSHGFCQASTNKSTLIIKAGDDGYIDIGTYIVAVFPIANSLPNSANKAKAQSFSISWSASHNFRVLPYSVPFENWISALKTLYYKFEVHPTEDKTIILHKTTTSSSAKVNLYLSNSVDKFTNNATEFHADWTSNGSDTIKLKEQDIITLCRSQQKVYDASKKCYLYVAVATPSEEQVHFILTLTKDFDDLRLPESTQTYYSFPEEGHPLHLYYYPHHFEDITIMAHTWGRQLTLYANVINTKDHHSRHEWTYPTDKIYEHTAQVSHAHKSESRLHIPAADLAVCGADYDKFRCGIAVTLYYGPIETEGRNNISQSHYREFSMFSIIANQEIVPISEGKPIQTSISAGSYRYFDLYVNKDEAILLISVSVLSGKHVTILATKGKDARPTLDNYEFISNYGTIESLQISGEQTLQGTAKGDWVIAIYATTQAEITLNVVYEKTKIIELHRGLPSTVDISKDPVFFEYYHDTTSTFQLKLTRERGTGIIAIKKYPDDKLLAGNLPNDTNADMHYTFDDAQQMITISNATDYFAKDCLYVIGIYPYKSMKVSIVAQVPGQFIILHDSMIFADYASNTLFNRYEYIAWDKRTIDINLVVYSGEPHIYISHNPTVNSSNHLWSYERASKNNVIRIKLDTTQFEGKHLDPVYDGNSLVASLLGNYYIMVTAPVPSEYTLAISVSNATRYLLDGHLDFGFLNKGEYNIYKYHASQDTASPDIANKLKLQVAMYTDEFTSARHEKFHKPNITVMAVPQNTRFVNPINPETLEPTYPIMAPDRSDVMKRSHGEQIYLVNLQYTVPSEHDLYIIVNNIDSPSHLNYSVTANTHEPIHLAMNHIHASRIAIGDSDIYAVHASHAGILVLEIHECMGDVVVQTSNTRHLVPPNVDLSRDDLPNYKPSVDDETFTGTSSVAPEQNLGADVRVQSSMGPHITLASLEIQDAQTVYIIVTARDGDVDSDTNPEKSAVYKIRPQLHPLRNFLPFTNLAPGSDGNVQWDITNDGKVKLGFDEIQNLAYMSERVRSTKFGDLDIEYKYDVILTKDMLAAMMIRRCDMMPAAEGSFKNMDTYYDTLYFDQHNISTDANNLGHHFVEFDAISDAPELFAALKITAIGRDSNGETVWDYPVNYKIVEVKNTGGIYSFLTFLLGLCLVMLVVAVGGMYYYYQKFKRVKARLNYEMQDLRNIAETVESFDILEDSEDVQKKGGYHGLIEEEGV